MVKAKFKNMITKTSKLTLLITVAFLLFGLSACNRENVEKKQPKAKNGVLDLLDWDFNKGGSVALDGEWQFYWKEFIEPNALKRDPQLDENPSFMSVPGAWIGQLYQEPKSGKKIKLFKEGFLTYRLKVFKPVGVKLLLKTPMRLASSYRIFVNGQLVAETGKPGKTIMETQASIGGQIISLPEKSEHIFEILIHAANFHTNNGKIGGAFQLGEPEQIYSLRERALIKDIFLFSTLLIMGLYHLGLFSLRRKNRSTLYFGLTSICLSIRTLATGENLWYEVFRNIPFSWTYTTSHISVYLVAPFLLLFSASIFPKDSHPKVVRLLVILPFFLSIFALITPFEFFKLTDIVNIWIILCTIIYVLYIVAVAVIRKREGSRIFLSAYLLLFLFAINDILITLININSVPVVSFAFISFILVQSYFLSLRFSNALSVAENFSGALKIKVEERTHQLEQNLVELNEKNVVISKQAEQLKMIAAKDFLTGLSNRRDFLEKANQEEIRFNRTQRVFSIVLLDIDHFKRVNDTFGHECGDKVLIGVARSLEKALRHQDMVARWGGEEFICLLPETENEGALHVAEKIRKSVSDVTHTCNTDDIAVTVTLGVSVFSGNCSLEQSIELADRALYAGKEHGRNQVCTTDSLNDNGKDK